MNEEALGESGLLLTFRSTGWDGWIDPLPLTSVFTYCLP